MSRRILAFRYTPKRTFATATSPRISRESTCVSLSNDAEEKKSFSHRWLRDSCSCPACIHPTTRQKLHRSSDVLDAVASSVSQSKDGEIMSVQWADVGAHVSHFSRDFLSRYGDGGGSKEDGRTSSEWGGVQPVAWDAEAVEASPSLFLPYDEVVHTDRGLLRAIEQLAKYGLVFMSGVPTEETSNEKCEVRNLAGRFGQLRETFYGETWDVRNVRESRNVAYTNIFLGFHMDMLYFKSPPRYQFLHCLKNRVDGGESMFVDALKATADLRVEFPLDFDILSRTPVPFHYDNDGHHFRFNHPTIELDYNSYTTAEQNRTLPAPIRHINYSPPFQAPLYNATDDEASGEFYGAMRRFDAMIERKGMKMEYVLKEGDAVLFDNRRVLHARNAFTEIGGKEGETNRWLKGCYIEADDVQDRWRVLSAKDDQRK